MAAAIPAPPAAVSASSAARITRQARTPSSSTWALSFSGISPRSTQPASWLQLGKPYSLATTSWA